jgi:hypothetical protein
MPPNVELVDLMERASLEGQNDGVKAGLAYWSLRMRESAAYFAQNGT